MIHIEITEGPDRNVRSPFKYIKNQVYVGRTSGDLWINDPDLYSKHVMLESLGSELLIHPQKEVEFYLINGKRATAVRKLKINDVIQIGQTKLKILGFEESVKPSKKDILNEKLAELIEENSSRLHVVESLTKKMKEDV